jgi:hypothetical protein
VAKTREIRTLYPELKVRVSSGQASSLDLVTDVVLADRMTIWNRATSLLR